MLLELLKQGRLAGSSIADSGSPFFQAFGAAFQAVGSGGLHFFHEFFQRTASCGFGHLEFSL